MVSEKAEAFHSLIESNDYQFYLEYSDIEEFSLEKLKFFFQSERLVLMMHFYRNNKKELFDILKKSDMEKINLIASEDAIKSYKNPTARPNVYVLKDFSIDDLRLCYSEELQELCRAGWMMADRFEDLGVDRIKFFIEHKDLLLTNYQNIDEFEKDLLKKAAGAIAENLFGKGIRTKSSASFIFAREKSSMSMLSCVSNDFMKAVLFGEGVSDRFSLKYFAGLYFSKCVWTGASHIFRTSGIKLGSDSRGVGHYYMGYRMLNPQQIEHLEKISSKVSDILRQKLARKSYLAPYVELIVAKDLVLRVTDVRLQRMGLDKFKSNLEAISSSEDAINELAEAYEKELLLVKNPKDVEGLHRDSQAVSDILNDYASKKQPKLDMEPEEESVKPFKLM